MKRSPIRPKRATPRRREAPRWSWEEWETAGQILAIRCRGGCEKCGTTFGPFERHHRKRRRDGGDRFSNIVLLCRNCHTWVTEHPAESRRAGWMVSVSRDPAVVPFLRVGNEWVLLDDDGGVSPLFDVSDAHDFAPHGDART